MAKIVYPPLKLIDLYEMQCPNIFNKYEEIQNTKDNDDTEYDIATYIAEKYSKNSKKGKLSQLLLTIAGWRKYKMVYSFSEELIDWLSDMEESDIDVSIFDYLPYKSFYIELKNIEDIHGIIVRYYQDVVNNSFCILPIRHDASHSIFVFDFKRGDSIYNVVNNFVDNFNTENTKSLKKALLLGFQCAMYLCTKNSDIQENEYQKSVYKKTNRIKNKFSEIRKWDVGYRIVKEEKKKNDELKKELKKMTERKRPRQHWRKSHWHTYLVGKGRQRRELRFIAPILVNDIGDNIPIVEHQSK